MVIKGKSPQRLKESFQDKVFLTFKNMYLLLSLLLVAYPLIYIVSASFSDPEAVMSGKVLLLPVGFNIVAYKAVFNSSKFRLRENRYSKPMEKLA